MTKLFVKKDDMVLVIAGKDKGKQGKVLEVSPDAQKVLVDGINIVSRHTKPKSQKDKGGIVKKPAFFDASNVMVLCPTCGKATRVARKEVDNKNTRVCKKCSAVLDKKMVKVAKTEAKKTEKVVKAEVKKPEAKKVTKKTAPKNTAVKTAVKTATAKVTKTAASKKTAGGK